MRPTLIACLWTGLTVATYCAEKPAPTYEKATIAITSAKKTVCQVQTPEMAYQFSKCQELHEGEAVEFRVAEKVLYIRTRGAKELKRSIEATEVKHDPRNLPLVWLKGTIQGHSQSDINVEFPGIKVKVYKLRGVEANYEIDRCGSFQAGKFAPGQEVEYRVDGERLYIRHDGDQEYACQIEGRTLPDSLKPADASKAVTAPGSTQRN